jgi:hypothetical protein
MYIYINMNVQLFSPEYILANQSEKNKKIKLYLNKN